MAEPRWPKALIEEAVGAGNIEGKEDTMNRAGMDQYRNYAVGHNDDGSHVLSDFMFSEEDTFTGDGGASQIVALTDTNLDILFIHISRPDTEYPVFASADMAVDETKEIGTNAFQADFITDIATTGQFTVGGDNAVNENLIVYHYLVLGMH
jgi:hypothetical protein